MATIDLDAARKAREEVRGPAPTIGLGGKEFAIPREAPFAFGEALYALRTNPGQREHMNELVRLVFGEHTEEFLALEPTEEDVAELLRSLLELWSPRSPGESKASPASSSSGSRRSKGTSKGSTGSTSATPSGGSSQSELVGSGP